jgi:hypothetical protein
LKFGGLPGEPPVIEAVGGAGGAENEVAVDNSSQATKGDVYVANGGHVGIYASTGVLLGELNGNVESEVPGAPWGEPCGVAVDLSGSVYVGLSPEHVSKYTPGVGENPVVNKDYVARCPLSPARATWRWIVKAACSPTPTGAVP